MNDDFFRETSEAGAPGIALPRPKRERWQPLRSGVLNIFKYDAEEFWFDDGRLLLRGNNGAGKSRILALQLPFLLDGELASHRVEPDGDPAKRMEWNLLMNRHDQRLGYTWIEFGRRDAHGGEHFFTLGCGMHARKGVGIPPNARWFFTTGLRMGETLGLMSENRVPFSRERLEAALGANGSVYRNAREYRLAVDNALFGLGTRYGPLIELLLQLRKPQIMRDFREDDLSRLLSEALPPLSPRLIESVAVSFGSLENDRRQLADLHDAGRSVSAFLQNYRHYVQIAVRRRAADVRVMHSRYEMAQRDIKRLADERETNASLRLVSEAEEDRIGEALNAARAAEWTLLDSPEMKSAGDLRRADELKNERSGQAQAAAATVQTDRKRWEEMKGEHDEAANTVERRTSAAAECEKALEAAWRTAQLPEPVPEERTKLEAAVQSRMGALELLRGKNSALTKAEEHRATETTRFEQKREDVALAEDKQTAAREACATGLAALTARIYEWESSLEVMTRPEAGAEDWQASFEGWLEVADKPSPLESMIETAFRQSTRQFAVERSRCDRAQEDRAVERETLCLEIDSLQIGGHPEPPAPYTRAPGIRADRPGAPFWKLCGFHDEISAADRAGFEAALEVSGLLDAWVTPEGTLIDLTTQDIYFTPAPGQSGAGLNRVLRAEGDMADIVDGILRGIGAAEHEGETWVSPDGRWQHGRLRGAWRKPAAEYLGHATREAARLRRLVDLNGVLSRLDEAIGLLVTERQAIDARDARLGVERNRAPASAPLRRLAHLRESAETAAQEERARLEEVDQLLARARESESVVRTARDRAAGDLGLENWKEPAALDQLNAFLTEVRLKAITFWPAREAVRSAQTEFEKAASREMNARDSLTVAEGRAQEAQRLATEAGASHAVLHATVGKSVEQVMQSLNEVSESLKTLAGEAKTAQGKSESLRVKLAVIEEKETAAQTNRSTYEEDRKTAVNRLQTFAEKRLLEEAGGNLQPERTELAATTAVELAREVERVLAEIPSDDESWKRAQAGIQQQYHDLNDQLGMRGYHPHAEMVDEGVIAITCTLHGQAHTMTALGQSLADETASREQMLDERERVVIENHLIGEIATELQSLIRAGEDWVKQANEELDRQPASSGIKLRFTWEIDANAAADLASARNQLLKMAAAWAPAERDGIGRFLHGRINAERAADESAPWQEHLRRALDYRLWHRFGILRFQDRLWKKMTKQTYGTGSGGEKALTLTLPQFAAAAAHYKSAAPHAPRLILLDEVFIGIDAPTRARLMSLLVSFDLDFVMTSEREWGCYPTLPALSICQLASRPDSSAVHVTRWQWNGRERLPQPHVVTG